ncbi:MAG: HAMP domain-containing sensor histidine kinase [bacterium]|nr:HAMP domain-containing sensor histidine kinase [bacterium]
MTLRWKIMATFVLILGVIVVVLSAAYHRDLNRFLLDHAQRTLRVEVQPTLDAYASRLAATGLPLGLLVRELARDLTTPAATAVVLDAAGRVLASGNILSENPDPLPPDPDVVAKATQSGRAVSVVQPTGNGRQMTLYIPLAVAVSAPQRVAGVVQLNRPLADIDRSLVLVRRIVIGAVAAALLAGSVLALMLARYLSAPLERLAATCRAIAAGEWGRRSELSHGRDEVGRLAASFDEMVQRLEGAFAMQHRFAADAAHQIRTPLTALSGHLELLERGVIADPERVRASYQTMRQQMERLDLLVRKLVTLAVLDAGVPMRRLRIDLGALARAVAGDFGSVAGQRLRVVHHGAAWAEADQDQLREALSNLVDNAIKHAGPEATVTIEACPGRLSVRDDGPGIPPERLERIFDRFYRHSRTWEGSGLGLAIVRSIVDAHGGRVWAESAPGRGTAFHVELPVEP